MPLDPQVESLLREIDQPGASFLQLNNVPRARAMADAFINMQGTAEDVERVSDILVPGPVGQLPVRVYHPAPDEVLPLIIYFHGGGWVLGNIEVADKPCRALANATHCVVASVEYRLSPETQFPGPAEDCYAATSWLAQNANSLGADETRLAVAGDSAGGNLAAVVSLMARDRGGPSIGYQVLIYPATVLDADTQLAFPSFTENASGYMSTPERARWYCERYLPDGEDGKNPYASPFHAPDLSGLPPALVVTAEFDLLRDEGIAYARRLHESGVKVTSKTYDGLIHGFFWMGGRLRHTELLLAYISQEIESQFCSVAPGG